MGIPWELLGLGFRVRHEGLANPAIWGCALGIRVRDQDLGFCGLEFVVRLVSVCRRFLYGCWRCL